MLTLPLLHEKDVEGDRVHRVTTLTGKNPEDVKQLIHMKASHMALPGLSAIGWDQNNMWDSVLASHQLGANRCFK